MEELIGMNISFFLSSAFMHKWDEALGAVLYRKWKLGHSPPK